MTKPLHERVDTPGTEDPEPEHSPHEKALRRHLSDLRSHLDVVESRIDEVETLLEGEVPETMAGRSSGGVPTTVGAGRLMDAFENGQRASGQIYALCAVLDRKPNTSEAP